MKNKILLVLLITLFFSCNNDDTIPAENPTKSIAVTINNNSYQLINENISCNENCNGIFVTSTYTINNNTKFHLNFKLLKNSELMNVRYDEFQDDQPTMKSFFTPEYDPVSKMAIKNFIYKPDENYVSFEFDGTVYEENKVSNSRQVSGKVEIENLKKTNCTVQTTKLEYSNTDLKFNSVDYRRVKYSPSNEQLHVFSSNNGFRLNIKSSTDFWELPLSTITFDETSSINTIEFQQYIGPLVAGQTIIYKALDWKFFETRGTYTIEQKVIENGFKTIKGKLNVEVLYEGNLIHNLQNVDYSVGSFVN